MPEKLLAALLLLSLATYLHAMRSLFLHSHGVPRGMRLIQLLGALSGAAHLYAILSHNPGIGRTLGASAVYALALLVFGLARRATIAHPLTLAYSPDNPTFLLSTGIYRWIRHPFYASYMLTWLGGIVSAPSGLTIATTCVMAGLYARAAILEEEKFANSALRSAYSEYRQRTGMFCPRWPI